jgi:hypothetical protein
MNMFNFASPVRDKKKYNLCIHFSIDKIVFKFSWLLQEYGLRSHGSTQIVTTASQQLFITS